MSGSDGAWVPRLWQPLVERANFHSSPGTTLEVESFYRPSFDCTQMCQGHLRFHTKYEVLRIYVVLRT